MSLQTLLAIGSGGFIGAILRAYLNGVINKHVPHDLPFGTLGVNLIGSLTLGVLFALFTYTDIFSPHMKSLLSTGMMGALTTYSTFALETFWLFSEGSVFLGFSNMMLNVFGTVLFAGIGFKGLEYILK
ncbi:MAG: fluoride efflux transporter CrcB [Sulfurospirillaceae bacterium]|nr:fluoride efflux transporter CrcB [Sulfurospirillaceae bacterium]